MAGSESFFEYLKSQRESQNIEISEICEFTKISPKFIEAIETGDFTILPTVYMRLFLRSYANFIGADSAKTLKDFELYTTGKITTNKEFNFREDVASSTSPPHTETEIDSKPQISSQQIITGIGVILGILLLLWWASKITNEQTENIQSIQPQAEASVETVSYPENEAPKLQFNLTESKSELIPDREINEEENQSANLPDKLPLNDNDFLSEKFDTSKTITNFILSAPYKISVHSLEETKLHISKKQGDKTIELINNIVPNNWKQTFLFESTIQFEFWSSNQISVTLNERSIDNYLKNGDVAIRGSYEADKSQLYLSFYRR